LIPRHGSTPDAAKVTFTLDLEDHRPDPSAPLRYPTVTHEILEHLDAHGITGTFFVVGVVAEAEPHLVRDIAAAGHEIALHGWRHIPWVEHTPASLREDVRRGRGLLEELAGDAVVGYRAPTFSLIESTIWGVDVLADEGFTYSSSVLPTRNPLYGYPGAPGDPFLWPAGVAEFPVPIAGAGPASVPYLGGTYLRLLPAPLIEQAHRRGGRRTPWTYMHPYDVDTEERYWRVPDAGWLSPLLWVGRAHVWSKLDRLLLDGTAPGAAHRAGAPLRERLDEARRGGTFHPAEPGADRLPAREDDHDVA
jgi:polysaccharide deacetylase family protein (PEP-CTERM system associated)